MQIFFFSLNIALYVGLSSSVVSSVKYLKYCELTSGLAVMGAASVLRPSHTRCSQTQG